MKTLALDVGGANLKIGVDDGEVREFSYYFPFWKRKVEFMIFLIDKVDRFRPVDRFRVTMSAELADCYLTKEDGVRHILKTIENVVPNYEVISVDGKLLPVEEALSKPHKVASANWAATSSWIAKRFGSGILIDTGSTTTDVIPVKNGKIIAQGKTDIGRLQNSELVYSGILRTNVATLADKIQVRSIPTSTSSESFAITADVYTLLGEIPEEYYTCETPDGKGREKRDCMRRLARVVCSDLNGLEDEEIHGIAQDIREKQIEKISYSVHEVSERTGIKNAFVCGIGSFIAEEAAEKAGITKIKRVDISSAKALLDL